MDVIHALPHLMGILNLLGVAILIPGYWAIRRGDREGHWKRMLLALVVGTLFLVAYETYHSHVGNLAFAGEGGVRSVYFTLLAAHVVMAFVVFFMVPYTVFRAFMGQFGQHRRVARWTLPMWLFVCLSGFVVYVMAFHLYVPA